MGRGDEGGETRSRDAKRRRKTEIEETKKTMEGGEGEAHSTTKDKSIGDTYQASLEHEAAEAISRTEEDDQHLVASIISHVRTIMKEILKLKQDRSEQWNSEVDERKTQVLMLMLSLRRLSRVQKVRVRDAREKTSEARQGVDGVTLQLQNLLYEVAHLKKEVRRCLDFQSADEEIDLVPVEQFYIEAPEDISRPVETVENIHEQRLARLQWELVQRRDQTQLFDKLSEEKEAVSEAIGEQERKLASLAPRINAILEATRPLQTALNLPIDAKREQQRIVQLLPSPLYTLWVQVSAYGEAFDSSIRVEVFGDTEAARKLNTKEEEPRPDIYSESDNDQDQQEENILRKKRSHKTQKMDTDELDDGVRQTLSLHPLHVKVTVNTKEGNSVVVCFHYMQVLRIITAKCSVHLVENIKTALTDVISGDTLLSCLFPGDDGCVSPNPANFFQLSHMSINLSDHLTTTGRPYKWAQNLAGISFSSYKQPNVVEDAHELSPGSPTTSVPSHGDEMAAWQESAEQVPFTIQAIRRRLQARLALHTQLLDLETATSTSCINIPGELLRQHFPGKVCSELKSWRPITWEDYESSPATKHLRETHMVTPQHLLFLAVLERKQVMLEAQVAVAPDHPSTVPVVALALTWEGLHYVNSIPQLRQMEKEINVHWDELVSCRTDRLQLLPLILYRLAVCLDVFTEASSAHGDPDGPISHFHKEKIFFRPARGPDRAFPFKYHPKLGVFSQR